MTTEASIYPIKYLTFTCNGCQIEWTLFVDPPLRNIHDFKRYTTEGRMGGCPQNCGSTTCSIKIKVRPGVVS